MSASDLSECRAKTEWSKTQIEALDAQIISFFETKACSVFEDIDSNKWQKTLKFKLNKPVIDIRVSVGAVVNSLRSSLDLLACALARRNGATKTSDVYFPISASEVIFLDDGMKKIKRLSDADKLVIKNLKPYDGGNPLLYALHSLDKVNKHSRLVKTYGVVGSVSINNVKTLGYIKMAGPSMWGSLEDGSPLVFSDPEAEYEVSVDIGLREVGAIKNQPVITVLNDFLSLTNSIISLFEAP